MKLHPRHVPVEQARRELGSWLIDWQKRHDLTDAEFLALLSDAQTSRLWSHVRSERTEGDDS
jgi:hypothetical protein